MTLDEAVLEDARQARQRLVDLESQTAHARVDYHHAIKKLHAAGGSLREIAEALELSHQRVHQIVEGPPAGPFTFPVPGPHTRRFRRRGSGRPFFARFDDAARQVMVEAQQEADSLKHNYVGTEHILLALLRRGTAGLEATLDAARAQIVEKIGEGAEPWVPGMPRPFTPRAKRAMERALVEASGANRERITPEDLLVALAGDLKGTAGEVLQSLGVTPEQLRERLGR
jgi:DNA-binding transcriptional MerR regulator